MAFAYVWSILNSKVLTTPLVVGGKSLSSVVRGIQYSVTASDPSWKATTTPDPRPDGWKPPQQPLGIFSAYIALPDPDPAKFTAITDVTKDMMVQWVKDILDSAAKETAAAQNLQDQLTPPIIDFMPTK